MEEHPSWRLEVWARVLAGRVPGGVVAIQEPYDGTSGSRKTLRGFQAPKPWGEFRKEFISKTGWTLAGEKDGPFGLSDGGFGYAFGTDDRALWPEQPEVSDAFLPTGAVKGGRYFLKAASPRAISFRAFAQAPGAARITGSWAWSRMPVRVQADGASPKAVAEALALAVGGKAEPVPSGGWNIALSPDAWRVRVPKAAGRLPRRDPSDEQRYDLLALVVPKLTDKEVNFITGRQYKGSGIILDGRWKGIRKPYDSLLETVIRVKRSNSYKEYAALYTGPYNPPRVTVTTPLSFGLTVRNKYGGSMEL